MYKLLSYSLSADIPLADPIVASPRYEAVQSIARGDLVNLFRLTMFNHCGTHIDSPNHFDGTGKKLADFPIEHFVFEAPLVLDIPKEDQGLITEKDCRDALAGRTNCDLVLLRTGFERYRRSDPDRYIRGCPGVAPEAASYLRAALPHLRAIGLDFASLEWTEDKSHGFRAHQVLLKEKTRPMLIIEDMSIDVDPRRLRRVFAIPIFFQEIDSFPATVFAEVD